MCHQTHQLPFVISPSLPPDESAFLQILYHGMWLSIVEDKVTLSSTSRLASLLWEFGFLLDVSGYHFLGKFTLRR